MGLRYRVKITRGGYIYIGLTIVIAVGAVNTGNNLLYLISSLMLSGMLVSGLSSLLNLAGLHPMLVPPKEVFANTKAPFLVELERTMPLPSVLLRVSLRGEEAKGCFVSQKERIRVWLSFESRGEHRISQLELSSGFPFGFFVRTRYVKQDLKVVVFPKPIPVPLEVQGDSGRGEVSAVLKKGDGDEIIGLREYREGDPPKQMDWKATARRGEPMVREMTSTGGNELEVLVQPGAREEDLSRAAYLVVEGLKRGYRVGLRIGEDNLGMGRGEEHKLRLLTALALW